MADKDDDSRDAAPGAEQLYRWWLGALPGLFGGREAAPDAAAQGGRAPFPADQMGQALKLTQHWLSTLYEGYLRHLVTSHSGDQLRGFEQLVAEQVSGMADRLVGFGQAFSGRPNLAELNARLTGAPLAAFGEALKPLGLNLERAYGGLADAFGLAPLRDLEEAGRDMALASLAHRQAQLEYLEVVAEALQKGAELLTVRLAELGQRGESIDSMLGLVRLWARTTDEAMHGAMQTPRALEASARLLRASARSRRQQQRVVAIASEALNVPTRAEVDEAYREIQELKRELRRLRKPVPAAPEAVVAAAPPAAARKTRRRKAATA